MTYFDKVVEISILRRKCLPFRPLLIFGITGTAKNMIVFVKYQRLTVGTARDLTIGGLMLTILVMFIP